MPKISYLLKSKKMIPIPTQKTLRGRGLSYISRGLSPDGEAVYNVEWPPVPIRRYVWSTLFLILSTGLIFYWTALPLVNSIFDDGYPRSGTPPSPNEFQSARYLFDWWLVWVLTLNALVPFCFALALTNNLVEEYARMHDWISSIFVWINGAVVVMLTVQWLFFCNGTFLPMGRACADYRNCCVNFPAPWCPNTMPCTPAVASLDRNHEMLQHWVFGIVFGVMSYFHRLINRDLTRFGVFH